MKRTLKGKFSKKQHYKLPCQDTLKIILPFAYAFIIAFTGTYISEAKEFHANYIKQIYAKTKITVYPNLPAYQEDGGINQQDDISLPETERTRDTIEDKIRKEFGDGNIGEMAVAVAMCESNLDPNRIGDKHLMFYRDGELVGDSIGVFQIRTAGRGWKRGGAEFRELMKNPDENIKYAKELYDKSGWMPWYNCKNKLGI